MTQEAGQLSQLNFSHFYPHKFLLLTVIEPLVMIYIIFLVILCFFLEAYLYWNFIKLRHRQRRQHRTLSRVTANIRSNTFRNTMRLLVLEKNLHQGDLNAKKELELLVWNFLLKKLKTFITWKIYFEDLLYELIKFD